MTELVAGTSLTACLPAGKSLASQGVVPTLFPSTSASAPAGALEILRLPKPRTSELFVWIGVMAGATPILASCALCLDLPKLEYANTPQPMMISPAIPKMAAFPDCRCFPEPAPEFAATADLSEGPP